ncbi:MAG TPA: DUF2017 family protein [Pseudolysinimonas sp.]|nr:DUF2017 family protein [Pseudolysinimonas sp.]
MTSIEIDGAEIRVELSELEHRLLTTLLTDYTEQVDGDGLAVLFPNAYPDDPDAAAEFARYTRSGLVDRKTANAGIVVRDLATGANIPTGMRISLTAEAFDTWMPILTDLRRILADRLGIEHDDDPVDESPVGDVYQWLGELQWRMLEALDTVAIGDAPQ